MRNLLFIYFIIFNKRTNRTRRAKRLRIQFMPEFVALNAQKVLSKQKRKK